uniref:Uncharacterized protein n=1 Tax=Medicago truncatula TaxID=3880 RepID=A2Q4R8_MEDTR|nr:hypothetical protein MtrDRAFT_AC157777g34v2 [Medicago truncatula]
MKIEETTLRRYLKKWLPKAHQGSGHAPLCKRQHFLLSHMHLHLTPCVYTEAWSLS